MPSFFGEVFSNLFAILGFFGVTTVERRDEDGVIWSERALLLFAHDMSATFAIHTFETCKINIL